MNLRRIAHGAFSVIAFSLVVLACASDLQTVPEPPDLDAADAAVRDQYGELRRALEESVGEGARVRAEAYGRLAMWFHAYRLPESAEVAYDNALKLAPGAPKWSYLRGLLREQQGDLEGAEGDYAVAATAGSEAGLTRWSEVKIDLGDVESAIERLEALLGDHPASADRNVRAVVTLARALEQVGDTQGAVDQMQKALAVQSDAPELTYQLGTWLRRLGREGEAQQLLGRTQPSAQPTLLRMPDPWFRELRSTDVSTLGLIQAARQAMAAGHDERALNLFRAAGEAAPERFAPAYGEARALFKIGRTSTALTAAEDLVRRFPERPDSHLLLARVQLRIGHPNAEEALRRTLELNEDSVVALRLLADVERSRGQLEEAEQLYLRAHRAAPPDAKIVLELAALQLEAGRREQAVKTLREALPVSQEPWALRLELERIGAGG